MTSSSAPGVSIDLLVPNRDAARGRAANQPGAKVGPDGEVFLVGVWWRFKEENEVDAAISRTATGWIETANKARM